MNLKMAKKRYGSQMASAKRRGIEWKLSFDEWLKFWGNDLAKRGAGHDKLCMQRFHDAGPYHPDNCRKDYPLKNAKTAGVIRRGKNAQPHKIDWDAVYFAVKAYESA
jgi:hypothetical protein